MDADTTLSRLRAARIVAVLRCESGRDAIDIAEVLIEEGITAIEVALTTPDALGAIRKLYESCTRDLVLGAGTVTTADQARDATFAGAQFLVSPGCVAAVVESMQATGALAIPGVLTPTEVMTAAALGVRLVKLFPASAVGPAYLHALRGPFPSMEFMPTGGIDDSTIGQWFAAGAMAVGVGGAIAPARAQGDDAYATLRASAQALLAAAG